ncbi:hypothetical protein MRX96_035919 [Rhipicephalus microplus]
MASFARDLTTFRYFRDAEGGKREVIEKLLTEEKKRNPSKIHYFVSASREFPGKFMLSYLPRVKVRHEYVTVTPEGFRYRQQMFHSVGSLFRWFKEHFRDPIPGTPSSGVTAVRTPMGQSSYIGATPSINISNVDPQAIQRAAANISSHMFASLSQVAGQTPSFPTPYGGTYANAYPYHQQPYTPSQAMATPLVTPSYHHAVATPSVTPRYPQTPQTSWAAAQQTPRGAHTPRHTPAAAAAAAQAVIQANPIPTVVSGTKSTGNPSIADWKRMAEQWAKQRMEQQEASNRAACTSYAYNWRIAEPHDRIHSSRGCHTAHRRAVVNCLQAVLYAAVTDCLPFFDELWILFSRDYLGSLFFFLWDDALGNTMMPASQPGLAGPLCKLDRV